MKPDEQQTAGTCPAKCSHCTAAQRALDSSGGPSGWRLVGWSAGAFLLPFALAIVGAAASGGSDARRAAGAVVGFIAGVALAVAARLIADRIRK